MFRYFLIADDTTEFNESTMKLIEEAKAAGWTVTDAVRVRVVITNEVVEETSEPAKGVPACKIIFS